MLSPRKEEGPMIRLLLTMLTLAIGLAAPAAATADPMADLRAGNASFKEGKYDDAVQAYTRAIISGTLSPEALAVTFNNRGVAYGELGDFDRAILDYNEALGLRPEDTTSMRNLRVGHVKRGVAAANLGEQEQAIADFTKAIELDPSHFLAYLRRGQVLSERGELDRAIADLETAKELAPDNTQAPQLLARARAMREQAEAAAATADVEPAAPPPAEQPAATGPITAEPDAEEAMPREPGPEPSVATAEPPAARPAAPQPAATAPRRPEPGAAAPRQPEPTEASAPRQRNAAADLPESVARMRLRQAVNMRAGPDNSFRVLTTLPGGTIGTVQDEELGWYELEIPNGPRGWIYKRWLEPAP
jgi:Flp pilus assembly protein TadD